MNSVGTDQCMYQCTDVSTYSVHTLGFSSSISSIRGVARVAIPPIKNLPKNIHLAKSFKYGSRSQMVYDFFLNVSILLFNVF